jgi:hypothetical protein
VREVDSLEILPSKKERKEEARLEVGVGDEGRLRGTVRERRLFRVDQS